MHACEEDLVCKGSIEKVPYFNAPIYLENKSQIGKVDEIFGPINGYVSFTKRFFRAFGVYENINSTNKRSIVNPELPTALLC